MKGTRIQVTWIIGLLAVLILAAGVNIVLTLRVGGTMMYALRRPSLPCAAVPMTFVSDYPECADHLLRAMNVTNVRVLRFNGTLPGADIPEDPIITAWRARRARANATTRSANGDGPSSS